ncbi:hypothetical protein L914_02680, partial [Phytophthora nicotianae]
KKERTSPASPTRRECSEATEVLVISFNQERYVSLTAETCERDPDSRVFQSSTSWTASLKSASSASSHSRGSQVRPAGPVYPAKPLCIRRHPRHHVDRRWITRRSDVQQRQLDDDQDSSDLGVGELSCGQSRAWQQM